MRSVSRRRTACIDEQLEQRLFLSATVPTNHDIGSSPASVNEAGGVIAQYVPSNATSPPAPPSILFASGNLEESQGLVTTVSINAGASWSTPSVIATGNDGLPEAYGQPSAAFDSNGNLFLAYIDQNRQQIDVLMQPNSDVMQAAGPTTFSIVGTLTGNVSHPELAISSVVTNNNNVALTTDYIWLIYQRSNDIVYTQASDSNGSVTPFETAKQLRGSAGGFLPSIAAASGPTASPEIAVAFQKSLGRIGTAIYESSTPSPSVDSLGLPLFVTNSNVTDRRLIPSEPDYGIDAGAQIAIGANPNNSGQNRVYVTYVQEYPAAGSYTDIYIRYRDPGAGWSSPMRVNDDGGLNSPFDPAIAGDPSNGDVGLTWYDARQDMGTGGPYDSDEQANDDVLEYGTYIIPQSNGLQIYPNAQISQAASNAKDADSPVDLGESAGLVFDAGALYPLWSDNGNYQGTNPNGTRQQLNLYTADQPIGNFAPVPGAPIVSPLVSSTGSILLSLNGLAAGSALTEKLVFPDQENIASGFTGNVLTFVVIFTNRGASFNPSDTTSVLSLDQSGNVTSVSARAIPRRQAAIDRWVERYTVDLNSPGVYTIESAGFSYNNNLDAFPSGILGEVVVSNFSGTEMPVSG